MANSESCRLSWQSLYKIVVQSISKSICISISQSILSHQLSKSEWLHCSCRQFWSYLFSFRYNSLPKRMFKPANQQTSSSHPIIQSTSQLRTVCHAALPLSSLECLPTVCSRLLIGPGGSRGIRKRNKSPMENKLIIFNPSNIFLNSPRLCSNGSIRTW